LSRSTEADCKDSGFTLLEALVALAIVAASLSPIGALIATTIRGTRSIESHLAQLETAGAIEAALPDRDQLVPGNVSGETASHRWRVDVTPFRATNLGVGQSVWEPQAVAVTVQSPSGGTLLLNTVRLHRRAAGP
jgi:general secretion pathway protein I